MTNADNTIGRSRPFFVVGSERSGTTLLRLMLSHHPRIACAPEFEFLVDFLPPGDGWPDMDDYVDYLSTNRVFLPHGLAVDSTKEYPDLALGFLRDYCAPSGKALQGATCHHFFDRLPRVFEGARYVNLVRDGRDVARSCIGMGWASNVWFGAQRWIDAMEAWEALKERVGADQLFELRYEDLVTDPVGELTKLAEFLGETFEPAMLEYVEGSTYGAPDPSLIEQWRRKLSPGELGLLETRIGGLLRKHGYDPSGVEPTKVGAAELARLTKSNRLGQFKHSRAKYGLALIIKGRLARGLGLKGLGRRVQLERNAIDNEHIK
ncbi:MAG: hypothetical protein ACI8QS_001028 [Planctomycetota bacterium]|jgi:hypothetical protein